MDIDLQGAQAALTAIHNARLEDARGRAARSAWIVSLYKAGVRPTAIERALRAAAESLGLDPTESALGVSEATVHNAVNAAGAKAPGIRRARSPRPDPAQPTPS